MMKKLHRARDFLAGILVMTMAMALIVPAKAILTEKTISVRSGVRIYMDGVEMTPTDAKGNRVEAFIYNGTTYVPIRAVSQYLGKAVDYDGATQSVYIGNTPGKQQYLLKVCPPYMTDSSYDDPATFSMGGKQYSNGFTLGFDGSAIFNLNGQYDALDMDIGYSKGNVCDTDIFIYLDGNLSQTLHIGAEELPKHVSIPLNNALQLKIVRGLPDGVFGNTSHYGFANAILS